MYVYVVLKSVSEGKLQGKKGQLQARLDNWIIIFFSLFLPLLFTRYRATTLRVHLPNGWCMKSFRY